MTVVVETNVLATANHHADHASPGCVLRCIDALQDIHDRKVVLVDDAMRIFDEYRRYASPSGKPGLGDIFMKWLWDNRAQHHICRQITITPKLMDKEDFEEFPDDPDLQSFDRSDRKWVAVALASGLNPPILNATDTDWWHHRTALARLGLRVEFLCLELMTEKR
jgi:hypothetical protein